MFPATLLVAETAAEGPPPLIDIDGTLFLQFVIFLVTLIILTRWLFGPYLALRDARERGIGGAKQVAKETEARAASTLANYESRLAQSKRRGVEERIRL